MTPDSKWYQGMTYYFTIVVKETNSDTVLYPYYCAVTVNGEKLSQEEPLNLTEPSKDDIVTEKPLNFTKDTSN